MGLCRECCDYGEQRIAKAREILARYERAMILQDCDDIVRAAMEALEGK